MVTMFLSSRHQAFREILNVNLGEGCGGNPQIKIFYFRKLNDISPGFFQVQD